MINTRNILLPAAAVMIGLALGGHGLAQIAAAPQTDQRSVSMILLAQAPGMQGHITAPTGVPTTGSEQGRGPSTGPGPMVTSPPNVVPNTGSAAGPESTGSMPPGHMAADPSMHHGPSSGPGPMLTSPGGVVPRTGAAAGAESPNSMPPGHMAADPNKK